MLLLPQHLFESTLNYLLLLLYAAFFYAYIHLCNMQQTRYNNNKITASQRSHETDNKKFTIW